MKTRELNGLIIVISCFIFLFLLGLGVILISLGSVSFKGGYECNSGFVGLDVDFKSVVQNKTCEDDGNFTCFKKDIQMNHLKLKNIDGLNCRGNIQGKLPYLALKFLE